MSIIIGIIVCLVFLTCSIQVKYILDTFFDYRKMWITRTKLIPNELWHLWTYFFSEIFHFCTVFYITVMETLCVKWPVTVLLVTVIYLLLLFSNTALWSDYSRTPLERPSQVETSSQVDFYCILCYFIHKMFMFK